MYKEWRGYAICVVLVLVLAGSASAGLVGHWTFDDGAGTTAIDSSTAGNDGTLYGGPQWVVGSIDGALEFDGTDDYVEVPRVVQDDFALTAWIKTDTPGLELGGHAYQGSGVLWSDVGGVANDFIVAVLGTKLSFFAGNPDTSVNSDTDIVTGNWVHVVAVRSAKNQKLTIYMDGEFEADVDHANSSPLNAQSVIHIGGNTLDSRYYTGLIDDVRMYDRTLTAEHVRGLYNGIPPAFVKAEEPSPPDGAIGVDTPLLQWEPGDGAVSHNVYFGTDPDNLIFIGPQGWTVYWHAAGLDPGTTYYWRIDEVQGDGSVVTGDVWSFTATPLTAWNPNPADGATEVMITAKLSWSAGKSDMAALKHHLFFGTDQAEVADGAGDTDKGILEETTYDPGLLSAETVYYFRVNEVETDGTEREGDLWSFETVAAGPGRILRQWWLGIGGDALSGLTGSVNYPDNPDGWEWVDLFEGPVDWTDSYGSRLSGWLFPPASGDFTFWVAGDNQTQLWLSTDEDPANAVMICEVTGWVPSRDFDGTGGGTGGGAIQRSAAIALEAGKRYYIEAIMKEGSGGDNVAAAWQGPGIPVREVISAEYVGPTPYLPERAYAPSPGDGATGVPDTVVVSWQAGVKAVQHDMYFGTDADAVAAADTTTPLIYRGRLGTTSYLPTESPLVWGQTYHMRVDEVNNDATITPGRLWSFTTADYIVIDDFEDYNDYSPDRIFQTWIDGYGYTEPPPGKTGNGTGSTVGYLNAPFAEQTIVHGGGQSMPLGYDNTGTGGKARYSEAEREWPVPQDFSRRGVTSMSLWVYGDPCNVPATLYVGLQDSTGTRVDVPDTDTSKVTTGNWQEINIELSRFTPVSLTSVNKIYLGVGNRLSPVPGPTGNLFIDDIRLYGPRCVASQLKPVNDLNDDCVVDYLDLEIVANEWLTSGHLVTPVDPGTSAVVAHYALDGNANDSVGGQHGTPGGLPTYGTGYLGQAIRCDGADDYVELPIGSLIGSLTNCTIATWANFSNAGGAWQRIFDFGNDTTAYMFLTPRLGTNGQMRFGITIEGGGAPEQLVTAPTTLPSGWHHVAVTIDADNDTITLYQDGLAVAQNTEATLNPSDLGPTTNNWLGRSQYVADAYYMGLLDEFRILNRALSGPEVAWLAGRTAPFSQAFDLNADGAVDLFDIAALGDTWLDELLWPAP
ncbi:MAG: hypothetical protein JSU70_07190 [Phycisphaerales bacterium]|nr:MAG: hypothetical protein JSU70_07190 [Phycisphaerales bacterium]